MPPYPQKQRPLTPEESQAGEIMAGKDVVWEGRDPVVAPQGSESTQAKWHQLCPREKAALAGTDSGATRRSQSFRGGQLFPPVVSDLFTGRE